MDKNYADTIPTVGNCVSSLYDSDPDTHVTIRYGKGAKLFDGIASDVPFALLHLVAYHREHTDDGWLILAIERNNITTIN